MTLSPQSTKNCQCFPYDDTTPSKKKNTKTYKKKIKLKKKKLKKIQRAEIKNLKKSFV